MPKRPLPRFRISARRTRTAHLAFSWVIESLWDKDGFITLWEGVYPTWHSAIHDLPSVAASISTRRGVLK